MYIVLDRNVSMTCKSNCYVVKRNKRSLDMTTDMDEAKMFRTERAAREFAEKCFNDPKEYDILLVVKEKKVKEA